ncbi:hypothetical protein HHL24_24060 [Paraburkholderia sp. RP-4-7]|jgi:hypothetical protein|uniref:Uncharacterized protein n=1 Tax=Paraburkholderia polaris TaxID=2728848 RepID=A0A848IFK3_9BURK|nr:hypothetical protein [Paraburkholderia polaris]NMM01002.1 hypothetical protein [Paraburkholderia polaris]
MADVDTRRLAATRIVASAAALFRATPPAREGLDGFPRRQRLPLLSMRLRFY